MPRETSWGLGPPARHGKHLRSNRETLIGYPRTLNALGVMNEVTASAKQ
jgi:hypothetical protein